MQNLNLPIQIPLSDVEMSRHIKNVLKYEDFVKLTFENILKSLPLVILYESAPGFGHWTLLHKINGGLEFFDSYGFKPDQEFKFIEGKYKQPHVLVDFLIKMCDKYPIHYNQYKLQEESPGINTCGRWVILREKTNSDIDTFAGTVSRICEQIYCTPDQLVAFLIQD